MDKMDHPLWKWRKANGKRLDDVAAVVRVSASHLSEIENGNNSPSLGLTARLSEFTGIPMADFAKAAEPAQ